MNPTEYAREVCRSTTLRPSSRCVLFALSTYVDRRTGRAWPSVELLGDVCGLSPGNVRRHLYRLVDAGVIAATARPGRTTVYTFPTASPIGAVDDENLSTGARAGARGYRREPRAVARATPRGAARHPARWRATEPSKEPCKERGDVDDDGVELELELDEADASPIPAWVQAVIDRAVGQ